MPPSDTSLDAPSRLRSFVAKGTLGLLFATLWQCGSSAPLPGEATSSVASAITYASVLTQHNDNVRTGANVAETVLTPANVQTQFGHLYDLPVTGWVYGQPLVATNVAINNGANVPAVMYVATMHNMVYAFDATAATPTQLLARPLPEPPTAPDPAIGDCNGGSNIPGEIGILSTPVIVGQTMYLISSSGPGTSTHHFLHALDIRTLTDLPGSPKQVNPPGTTQFQSFMQIQRSALLAANGMIYANFAAYCDAVPYHGFVVGFDANTLNATAVWNSTPTGQEGGIWQSGQGPAADSAGNVYVQTGNGRYTAPYNVSDSDIVTGGQNASEAMVKLPPSLGKPVDWFVPYNYSDLSAGDLDFASGGVMLLPGSSLVIGGGKWSTIYVTQQTNLGHYNANPAGPNIVQSLTVGLPNGAAELHGSPVYWNGPNGPHIYAWASNDSLKSFHFNGTTFDPTPQESSVASSDNPGAMLSISASGNTNGIVWAARAVSGSAEFGTQPGRLLAFDANDVTRLLWDSVNEVSVPTLQFSKNAEPTVANGRVFLPTFSNMIRVYGLGAPGRGFGPPTAWSWSTFYGTMPTSQLANGTQLADVNGDGKADAVALDGTSVWVMLSNGTGFGPPTAWSWSTFYGEHDVYSTQLADVNGDHKADAVAFDGTSVWVMLSNGAGFGPPTAWSWSTFYATMPTSQLANGTQLADVNGDGKADAVALDGTSVWVMLSNGTSFGPPTAWSWSTFYGEHDVYSTQLADVNGDGKADAVAFDGTSVWVLLSNGTGFGPPTAWSWSTFYGTMPTSQLANGTQLADVNGDGKADAVALDGTSVWVMLSNGTSFGPPTAWSWSTFYGSHDVFSTQLADINGDELADAVAFDSTQTWVLLGSR